MGIFGVIMYAIMLPKMIESGAVGFQGLPDAARVVAIVVALAFMSLFLFCCPGPWYFSIGATT
jgi:hypothetical protein